MNFCKWLKSLLEPNPVICPDCKKEIIPLGKHHPDNVEPTTQDPLYFEYWCCGKNHLTDGWPY